MEMHHILERAQILLGQGRTKDAMTELKRVLESEPLNSDALALYGKCEYKLGKFQDGIATIKSAIAQQPNSAYLFYLLGFGYYRLGDELSASGFFQRSIALDPFFAEPFGLQALMLIQQRKFEEALQKADAGLAIDPENSACLNARSTALNKLRRSEDAEETMKGALNMDPDNPYTHATVGWNYLEKGRHKEATSHFREALRLSPDLEHAQVGLKESLKSKIPPYRWLLQYSFWVQNKGRRAMLLIPVLLYVFVNVVSGILERNSQMLLSTLLVGLYLVFIVLSWIISPIANLFLYFHKDGRYALTTTEKWTALTACVSLLLGIIFLVLHLQIEESSLKYPPMLGAAFVFWLMAVPLTDIRYPLSWSHPGSRNKSGLVLSGVGILAVLAAFTYYPAGLALFTVFFIGFILNNWFGLFRNS